MLHKFSGSYYLCDWCLTGNLKIQTTGRLRVSLAGCRRTCPTMHCSPVDRPQLSSLRRRPHRCRRRCLTETAGSRGRTEAGRRRGRNAGGQTGNPAEVWTGGWKTLSRTQKRHVRNTTLRRGRQPRLKIKGSCSLSVRDRSEGRWEIKLRRPPVVV